MISFYDAIAKANHYLDDGDFPVVITLINRFAEGWVFCFQSKEYLETGDFSALLAGNSPFLIDKDSGEIHLLGTSYPMEKYLQEYEEKKKYDTSY
ncbi:YrhB domain-containing protein [Limnobaculum xujianqingii]|uniref:YrhB domain-containing protein n=1 Tax=Limnobaculum xujianqingii TaxID=2738837 RepID=UPI001127A96C|nr:YrhB domain-containing protein [Limnobaculum xujianqingii]